MNAIKEGKYWFSDLKFIYVLETEQPAKDGSKYMWPYSGSLDFGDFYVMDGEVKDIPEEGKKKETKGNIKAEFTNGA